MKFLEIAQQINAELIQGDAEYTSVSIDTRTINPGQFFVAIKGENFDGHDFVKTAEQRGAAAVMVDHKVDVAIPQLIVGDTIEALGKFASYWRSQFKIPVIAITGSCGKTTLKEMVGSICACEGKVQVNKGSFNNHIGMPLSLLRIEPTHDFAVIEMGANHPGEIDYLTRLAKPTLAIINNIAPAHLEGFGSIEGVAKAKSEIYNGLTDDGMVIINKDDSYKTMWEQVTPNKKHFYFSLKDKDADVYADNICTLGANGSRFRLHLQGADLAVRLTIPGEHHVHNAVAAATIAHALGINPTKIVQGLTQAKAVKGRMLLHHLKNEVDLLDDSYNANPRSMSAAIELLAQCKGQRFLVMGDMGELGENAEDFHQQIGSFAREQGIDGFFSIGKLSAIAADAFGQGAQHFNDHKALINTLRQQLNPKLTLLVKGSNSAKMFDVVEALLTDPGV